MDVVVEDAKATYDNRVSTIPRYGLRVVLTVCIEGSSGNPLYSMLSQCRVLFDRAARRTHSGSRTCSYSARIRTTKPNHGIDIQLSAYLQPIRNCDRKDSECRQ